MPKIARQGGASNGSSPVAADPDQVVTVGQLAALLGQLGLPMSLTGTAGYGAPSQTTHKITLDPRDYGAVGDNVADDTAAIQAAINAAHTAGGGTVAFPALTFKLTSSLTIKDGVILQGVGEYATYLRQTSTSANAITGTDVQHVGIRDLHVTGPGTTRGTGTGTGISLVLSGNAGNASFYPFLTNVYVEKFGVDGVALQTPIVCHLDRVTSFSNNRHGINVWSSGGADGTSTVLSACFAAGNYGAGYRLQQLAYSALAGCAADANGAAYVYDTCIAVVESGCGSEEPYDFSSHQTGYVGYSRWIVNSKVTLNSPYAIGNVGTAYFVTTGSVVTAVGLFEGSPGNPDSPTNNPTASVKVDAGCVAILLNPSTVTATSLASSTTTVLP